ncbi:MAG TPA: hypothetical protein ENJ64_07205 [Thiotrichales bacterium]|nr:hypothetical protein [Thiotrichales bacterium]
MPLLTISTNTDIRDPGALARDASSLTAEILGKPESYVMVKIEPVQALSFGGSHEPAAHLRLKSLGLLEAQTTKLSTALCDFITDKLDIPAARIYIEFASPERAMWGWDRRTFG